MLVYVNSFNCIGENSFYDVIHSICGWIYRVSHIKISPEDILTRRDFNYEREYVRTYSADKIDPRAYSVMYTHPDKEVGGRQWITEIGIRRDGFNTFVSILLEISDVSTLIDSKPVATRPMLVSYLKRNCEFDRDVIGVKVDYIKSQYGDFQYLIHEISRDNRNYPLVFISEGENGFPVKPEKLQEQLIGLAQVVATHGQMDSWEMERLLGRNYSSWSGAINIIYPINSSGYIGNKLIIPKQIEEMKNNGVLINNYILSIITHSYNGYKKKSHLSPVNVRAKNQRDDNSIFKERVNKLKDVSQYQVLFDEALHELDELKNSSEELELEYLRKIEELDGQCEELLVDKIKVESELERLRVDIKNIHSKVKTQDNEVDVEKLISIIGNKLSPESVLNILAILIPENVIILKSAYISAKASSKFKHSHRLIFLLYKLCTSYLSEYLENGDNTAKDILGDSYSANESETVERSATYYKLREFEYDGEKIKMFKHVGIGTARKKSETIRAHFHVDAEKRKIVIGYCGEHLDVKST
ncbi:hypothetical protein [Dickeya undicola]|uniref:hypothetical protein n=1 Tax=Dickeya undicola TaxID=1577887 RepID=UPI000ACF1C7D|nr:hypothetical protein [Dickeya undicola]